MFVSMWWTWGALEGTSPRTCTRPLTNVNLKCQICLGSPTLEHLSCGDFALRRSILAPNYRLWFLDFKLTSLEIAYKSLKKVYDSQQFSVIRWVVLLGWRKVLRELQHGVFRSSLVELGERCADRYWASFCMTSERPTPIGSLLYRSLSQRLFQGLEGRIALTESPILKYIHSS